MYGAFLFAWVFWLGLGLGCLGLLLLHHVFRAQWGRATLPALEAGARTLPLLFVLFLPVLLGGLPQLYPWAGGRLEEHLLSHRSPYLNVPFFAARFAIFFAVWIGMAEFLVRSRRNSPEAVGLRSSFSSVGLVAFVLTLTFAMTDWVMTLEPHWSSTIYGVWLLSGQALAAVALLTFWYSGRRDAHPGVLKDLGNLLLAFTLFWAYISLSQYLIMWSGNLPEEADYYLKRSQAGWNGVALMLMIGHFLIPFLALLSGRNKRSAATLRLLAGWILLMRAADTYWIVVPSVRSGNAAPTVAEVIAFLVLGILWLGAFSRGVRASRPNATPVEGVQVHA